MRCDQFMGLTPEAIEFLRENEVPENKCACCNRAFPRTLIKIDTFIGMFEDVYGLFRHFLKNGQFADEYLQAEPWSSGPCFFLGLQIHDDGILTQKFEWAQSEIDKA